MGRRKSKLRRQKNKKKIPAVVPSPEVPSPSAAPWIELPGDITANILQRLGAVEILERAQKVCTTWRRLCQDPAMWRVIDMKNPGYMNEEFTIMCRHAVDRSQGQLIDLSICYFGDDELLDYIADRSSHLRRLTLNSCYDISGKCLSEAVKKLPHLEELHLTIMPLVHAENVETIGISSPNLKSFTLNKRGSRYALPEESDDDDIIFTGGPDGNEYARAIAKNMPNLCHLRLFANDMKNEGLQAILDGCLHLESLDLRQCFRVHLGGDLGRRCSQQIKDLKRPSDSISDIEWLAGESYKEWGADESFYSGYSDICSFDHFDDYGYYDDFAEYDDYTSPFGVGFFADDGSWFFDRDDYI